MTEKEFVNPKLIGLSKMSRNMIEVLKQNDQFDSKSKAVQYLVDKNILAKY